VIYYVDDHLGSSHLVTDSLGNVLREESRFPYGLERNVSDSSVTADYVYTGKEYDTETGLIYFGGRYYAPELGRWITPDPLFLEKEPMKVVERPLSSNLYAYVRNNPMTYIDPTGEVENYTYLEMPASERDKIDISPRNVYEQLYVETVFIIATGGLAGPLLADDGCVDIAIPDSVPILGEYQVSMTDRAALGVYNVSSNGDTSLGIASLGVSMSASLNKLSVVNYGNLSIGLGRNLGITASFGLDEKSGLPAMSVSGNIGLGIGPPVTASLTPEGIQGVHNFVERLME